MNKIISFVFVFFAVLLCNIAFAFTVPAPTGYITDTTSSLTAAQVSQLNSKINLVNQKTKNEIGVLIIKSVEDSNIEDITHETFKTWKVGKAGLDNGILLVLAIESRKMMLQTGKGIEGEITDLQANDILASMKPHLRNKNYYLAIDVAVDSINSKLESRKNQKADLGQGAAFNKQNVSNTNGCSISGGVNMDFNVFSWVVALFPLVCGVILLARFLVRRRVKKSMQELERQVDAELAAARSFNALENEKLVKEPVPRPVSVPTVSTFHPTTTTVANAAVKSAASVAKVDLPKRYTPRFENSAGTVNNSKPTVPRPTPGSEARAKQLRAEAAAETERLALKREEEAFTRRKQRESEEEDRRRRQREEDDRRSSSSSSSSYSSDSSSSYDSGSSGSFGGGDSGGGGSSSDF